MMYSIFQLSLLLCIILFMSGGVSSCFEVERQALLDVKANLTGLVGRLDDWSREEKKKDCCKWSGVTCDNRTGHVIELYLSWGAGKISPSLQVLNQLQYLAMSYMDFQSSPLPSFLGSLSNLQHLDMSGSNMSGPIPHQLANLSNLLYLNLGGNSLVGSIPKSFENCSSLVHLDFSHNHLNGSFPSFAGCSSLITFSVADNFLNGNMPDFIGCAALRKVDLSINLLRGNIPSSVSHLSNLEYLNVGYNSLNGTIPNFIGSPSLRTLDMSGNNLSGNVPNSLGQLSKLEYLDLSSNSLKGVISQLHFLNLTQLNYLDLSFNYLSLDLRFHGSVPFQLSTIKLQSCKLGPRFPKWIKTQKSFTHLDISNAGISGTVPDWFWDLPRGLKFLNLSSNQIKGMLPNIASQFDGSPGMDLSNNYFQGRIPSLPQLSALNLSGNRFSGTISLCDFATLTLLDLSDNSLSGSLLADCSDYFDVSNLVILNLSNNNLSGKIPSFTIYSNTLEVLYLRGNSFAGELPMYLSECTRLKLLDLGENNLSGVIPESIGEKLLALYVLVLGSNRFYGRLPSQVCWLRKLQVLDVSNNRLSGNIPRCLGNFTAMTTKNFGDDMTSHFYYSFVGPTPTPPIVCAASRWNISFAFDAHPTFDNPYHEGLHEMAQFFDNAWVTWKGTKRSFGRSGLQLLKSIDLSRNNLSGIIPHEVTSLYELVSLNLSVNKLHGEVPKDMGWLKSLESLDLSRNEFSGHIPWSLAQLNYLSYLDLSFNNLSGSIPTGSQLQRFDYTSYAGNPQLCGPPLTPRCGIAPVVEKKKVIEEDEDDSWKSYYTGMGTGFAVGFLGICGALIINRRCRYILFISLSYIKDWIYVTAVVYFHKLERKFRR